MLTIYVEKYLQLNSNTTLEKALYANPCQPYK